MYGIEFEKYDRPNEHLLVITNVNPINYHHDHTVGERKKIKKYSTFANNFPIDPR